MESLWLSGYSIWAQNPKAWGSVPHGDSEFFLCPTLVTRWKKIFLYWMSVMKIKLADMVSPLSRRLLFPHMKIFCICVDLLLTSLSGAFLQCCQKYVQMGSRVWKSCAANSFLRDIFDKCSKKKKKEMKKLPISNLLPRKRFEADLKYNSWRSLFLKTPLIELWLVWRD